MDPVVVLADTRLAVEPGEQVRTTATVRNAGTIVEQYELHVLGLAAGWSDVLPHEVSVLPGGEATIELVFRPPRDAMTPAGEVPFGFRCISLEHPDRMAVAEGDVAVGAILDADAQLAPVQSHGRWSGRHRLVLHNRGTVPVHFQLTATDPAEALAFALVPDLVQVPPGGRAEAALRVRTRRPFLRGQPKPLPFQISYQRLGGRPDEAGTGVIAGTFEQRPILSKMVLVLIGLALAGIAALIVLNLRKGDGPDSSVPPPAPKILSARTIGADKVQLVWARNPNATGYRVDKLLAAEDGQEPVVEDSKDVKPERSAITWEGLAAGTEHCFQVVALNKAGGSEPSDPSCISTPGEGSGTADPPTDLKAVAAGQQVELSWTPADKKAAHVILMDGTEYKDVPAGGASAKVDVDTAGKHCFKVLARIGENDSEPSNEECVTLGAATGGNGGLPGGPGTTGQNQNGQGGTVTTAVPGGQDPVQGFFVIFDHFREDDVVGQNNALQSQGELQELDIPAKFRRVSESESLKSALPGAGEGFVVYLDRFATRENALAFCAERRAELQERGHDCVAP